MALSFSGRPPVVAVPLTESAKSDPVTPNADAIKGVLVARLADTRGQTSASEQIHESEVRLVDDELQIQTNLSRTMLPVVIDAESERIMKATLKEYGVSGIRLKILPTKAVKHAASATPTPTPTPTDPSFKRLSDTAARLNEISDKLSKQVEQIDAALKRLSLGVTAWITIKNEEDEVGSCYVERVGYTKIGSRWCIALKTASGMLGDPNGPDINVWPFVDAPRQLRIRAVQHIPKLLESLCNEADEMIKELAPKIDDLTHLTATLNPSEGGR